jgi:hypothetical protein
MAHFFSSSGSASNRGREMMYSMPIRRALGCSRHQQYAVPIARRPRTDGRTASVHVTEAKCPNTVLMIACTATVWHPPGRCHR